MYAKFNLSKSKEGYAIILREEFSCLESITNRDTINWILKNEYRRSIMEHLPKRITENGIDYILVGDYYIPDLRLPEESRPIGRWGRMHRDYLKEWRPVLYNEPAGGNHRADESRGGNHRRIKAPGLALMGAVHEQHPQPGRRNHLY